MAVVSVLNQRAAISPSHAHVSLHLIVKCFYDFEFEAINMVFNGVADALKADHVASVISQIPRYHIFKQLQCLIGQTVACKPGHYQLTQHGIANSPRKVYATGQKCFLEFSHWRPFLASEALFCHFVAFLTESGFSYGSVHSYFAAVRHLHILCGHSDPSLLPPCLWSK